MKRILSLLLTMSMVLSFVGTTAFAAEYDDIDGHWAESAIQRWSDYGVVSGTGDGTFAPDANMTRAEMAQLYVNLLNLTEKADISAFTDVPAGAWYADAVAKCVAAGILTGTSATTVSPLEPVTREQMFVTFGRAIGLASAASTGSTLTDLDDVSDWAEGMVNALLDAGYVTGTDSNTLLPLSNINRASVVALLDQTVSAYGNESGATVEAGNGDGLVLVVSGGVTVTGKVGDLVVAQGAAGGSVTLEDADVTGTVTVTGAAQLAFTGDTSVDTLVVGAAARGAQVSVGEDASVGTVTTAAEDTTLTVAGTVDTLNVADSAANTAVTVSKGATVGSVATAGSNTSVDVAGTVTDVTVSGSASDTTITTQAGSKVESVTTSGSGTTVSGSGSVSKVEAAEGSTGATVTTPGTTVENNGSGSVTTDKGTVEAGETGTTSGGTTSGGGSSGGGTGGGSTGGGSVHTHTYVDGVCTAGDGAYDPAWAQVNSVDTWNDAVAAGKNIVLTADFTATAQLKITSAITVNGNGKTVTAGTWTDPNPTSGGDASLVSINNVTGAVVLKNITLTGAKHIVTGTEESTTTDYASGLNVYHSGNVTLNNVTLTGNAAAGMVVNSSAVNATGLHTSGNIWAGVNIDANVENAPASLTFDATSTFGEAVAVYSDKSTNVTVNCPDGWAPVVNGTRTGWAKLFDGGDGTVDNPYKIADAAQLAAVNKLSNQMASKKEYHFILTADIDYTSTTEFITSFCGTLDGDSHKISMSDSSDNALIGYTYGNVTIKDLTFVQTAKVLAMLTVFANGDADSEIVYENITFTSAAPAGTSHELCSYGASQFGMQASGKVSYINCVNEVSYVFPAGEGSYAGIFIGNYIPAGVPSTISFINCVNKGTINGGQIGFFFGNNSGASGGVTLVDTPAYVNENPDKAAIYVSGCRNEGTLLATLKCQPFLSVNNTTSNDAVNAELESKDDTVFYAGTMSLSSVNDMALSTENNQLKITPSDASASEIATYTLGYSVSTSYRDADNVFLGSWYFSVIETLSASEVSGKAFDYVTKVMLDTEYDQSAAEGSKYTDLAVGDSVKHDQYGNEYILVTLGDGTKAAVINSAQAAANFDNATTTMWCGTTPTYTLTAQNENGQNIGAMKYSADAIPETVMTGE